MKKKMVLAMLAAAAMTVPVNGSCAEADNSLDAGELMGQWVYIEEAEKVEHTGNPMASEAEEEVTIEPVHPCYALLDVTYCSNPTDAVVQSLDIYVPAEYMDAVDNGDGTYTCTAKDGVAVQRGEVSYTANDAPIIYQNIVGAYMQGDSLNLADARQGGPGVFSDYLESGYILVSVSARGRDSEVDGTAPAAIVDLKAGVRYLKANDEILPGDSEKIFISGTSAGGSLNSVLAASGNSPLYTPYLEEIGAADASDDIYGALIFCPIADLEVGDAAFEFLHSSETSSVSGWGEAAEVVEFDDFQLALQSELVASYEEYLSSIGLDSMEYRTKFLEMINTSIAEYVDRYVEDKDTFAEENPILEYDGDTLQATDIESFVSNYMPRKKVVPSFDVLDSSSNEAALFDGEHFSENVASVLESLSDEYEEAKQYAAEYEEDLTEERLEEVKLMSPLLFLTGEEESTIAPHWRFRNGTEDGDLGSVAAFTMCQVLENNGYDTEYSLIWGNGHCAADYEYEDVQNYIDETSNL